MKLLPVKTTYVPFRPYLVLNENPKDIFDKLSSSGHFYNGLLRHARLNATVFESAKLGECVWNGTQSVCSGIFGQIASGKVDFSLYPTMLENYDDRELFMRVKPGLMVDEMERVFLSTPQFPDRVADVSPFFIFQQFSLWLVLLNFVILMIVVVLINYRLKSRSKRICIVDAVTLHTLRWSRSYLSNRRRIIFIFILFYTFFSHYYYSGQVSSDLIVNIPAVYLKNLEEILASNRTPLMFGGLTVINDFEHSDNPVKKQLLARAAERGTLYSSMTSLQDIATEITYQGRIGILDGAALARNIQALPCVPMSMTSGGGDMSEADTVPKVRISDVMSKGHAGYLYYKGINEEVKERVEKTLYWLTEAGLYYRLDTWVVHQFDNNPSMKVNRESLINCLDRLERKKEPKRREIQLSFEIIFFFVKSAACGYFLAFICLLWEKFSPQIKKLWLKFKKTLNLSH